MLYYILVPLAWVLAHIVFRPQVIGRENLIKGRGFILAPNHRSALDPVFIVLSDGYFWLHKMRIFAKKELFQGKPLLAWFLRQMGAVSVKNGRDDLSTLDNTIRECRTGRGLLLFPEGTRSKDGKLHKAEAGVGLLAAMSGAPVVPACIVGTDRIMQKGGFLPKLSIMYGEPMHFTGDKRDKEQLEAFSQEIMAHIAVMREEIEKIS